MNNNNGYSRNKVFEETTEEAEIEKVRTRLVQFRVSNTPIQMS